MAATRLSAKRTARKAPSGARPRNAPRWEVRLSPPLYIMQSVDPVHLARAIGTDRGFWPLDYDLTSAQWAQREADAADMARIRFTTLHAVGGLGPSPVISYSRDLIRLVFLPKKLRGRVVEEIARIGKADLDRRKLQAPQAWRRKTRGRTPVYQWERPARKGKISMGLREPTVPERFQLIARLHADGYTTAEIVRAVRERFGMQWPGQREPHGDLTDRKVQVRLRKLHRDTVWRDVRKAQRERTRIAQQR